MANIQGLEFIGGIKKTGRNTHKGKDIMVAVHGQNPNRRLCITFYNDIEQLILADYIDEGLTKLKVAMWNNRLYVIPSSTGLTPSRGKKDKATRISFAIYERDMERFIGEYDLSYDKARELYYIETKKEKE